MKSITVCRPRRLLRLAALCFATAVSPPLALADHLEAKMYGVTVWDGGCSGSTRNSWDDMAQAWYDVMGDSSWYHKKFKLVNGNIINSKYADATKVSWGSDSSYLDDADAAILFWHGSEDGDVYKGSMRVDESGGGDCKVREDEMDLGDQDLEFLVLSSCHGLDDNQWKQWWKSFKGLHQLDSFHGLMWISSGRVDDYEDFAEDAFDGPMSDAWLDNLYDTDIGDDNVDQCPVAYGVGNGSTDLWDRIDHERYDNIKTDPTTFTRWGATFIIGCNPAGESVVDSDLSN
jgi:Family of unknown function (DUF6345)